jgi:putative restriction endonuclease
MAPGNPYGLDLRLALFGHCNRLRQVHGGIVPTAALKEGFEFRGERIPFWQPVRGIFRPAQLGRDGAALTIFTSPQQPYGDEFDVATGTLAYRFQGTDPESSDNVAMRRAHDLNLPLLYIHGHAQGAYELIFPVYVTHVATSELTYRLQVGDLRFAADTQHVMAELTLDKGYRTRVVAERIHQEGFRVRVLRAYNDRCAICTLHHRVLLDAAHILPDSDARSQPVVSNGLSLCKIHHAAYDRDILGIDPATRVHIREDILQEVDGPMLKHGLQELDGRVLLRPAAAQHRPNKDFLAERFARFKAA